MVRGSGGDPVDLLVTISCANYRSSLFANEGIFVRERGDGNIPVFVSARASSVSTAQPGVGSEINSSVRNPGHDVRRGTWEAGKT